MRMIINLIRWLYHFLALAFMIGCSIGMLLICGFVILMVICVIFGIDSGFINAVGPIALWIGVIITLVLAFLTAGNEEAEQNFLNSAHENHIENERRMEEQNRQMANWALKDYHRSKGRGWW